MNIVEFCFCTVLKLTAWIWRRCKFLFVEDQNLAKKQVQSLLYYAITRTVGRESSVHTACSMLMRMFLKQGRNLQYDVTRGVTRGPRGAQFTGRRITMGVPKNSNNVTSTLFITVHLLPKDFRFELGGAKLASFPERHLTSLRSRLLQQQFWCLGKFCSFDCLTNFMLKLILCASEGILWRFLFAGYLNKYWLLLRDSNCNCATALSRASERKFTILYEDWYRAPLASGALVESSTACLYSHQNIDKTTMLIFRNRLIGYTGLHQ